LFVQAGVPPGQRGGAHLALAPAETGDVEQVRPADVLADLPRQFRQRAPMVVHHRETLPFAAALTLSAVGRLGARGAGLPAPRAVLEGEIAQAPPAFVGQPEGEPVAPAGQFPAGAVRGDQPVVPAAVVVPAQSAVQHRLRARHLPGSPLTRVRASGTSTHPVGISATTGRLTPRLCPAAPPGTST